MAKLFASLGAAALVAVAAVLGGFFVLVALNGFGERAATPALVTYAVLALVAIGLGAGIPWLPVPSKLAATGLGIGAGLVVLVVGFFGAIVVAEAKHQRGRPSPPAATTDE